MAPAAQGIPDFMTDMNAVLRDEDITWLHGKIPNYDGANRRWERERTHTHEAGSLPDLVSNLVKNWEKEASHKIKVEQWRTIDPEMYTFACNGGEKSKAEDMIKLGTYNALIGESEYYASSKIDFAESHKVFRTALGDGFSWECLEVYSGPPVVAFKWRHWGKFNGELRCPMRAGEDLVIPPNHQLVEIFGVTIASVNEKFQITALDTYYNPNQLFENMLKKVEEALPEGHAPLDGTLKIALPGSSEEHKDHTVEFSSASAELSMGKPEASSTEA